MIGEKEAGKLLGQFCREEFSLVQGEPVLGNMKSQIQNLIFWIF